MVTASRLVFAGMLAVVIASAFVAGTGEVTPSRTELRFTDASNESGFNYSHVLRSESVGNGQQGVFAVDYNNDGWTDLLALGGNEGDFSPQMFRNVEGEFEKADALPRGAIELRTEFKSALFFDYDNDGWTDLLLLQPHGPPVMLENVDGEFEVRKVGIEEYMEFPVAATALDYDDDGCLDLFVAQSADWAERRPAGFNKGNETITRDNGNPNRLYHGTCDGFEPVNGTGITGKHWSLATSAVDFTGDGLPDIHVANDFYNNILYINRGNGTFKRRVLGEETDRNGMSSEVGDVNNDGHPDVMVTNINLTESDADTEAFRRYIEYSLGKRGVGNNLLVFDPGRETLVDRAQTYGVREGGWGWAAVLTDLDNDGDTDLFHLTSRLPGIKSPTFETVSSPALWEGQLEDGTLRFDQHDSLDRGFEIQDGRGVAALDYDRDGDVDLAVSNRDGRFRLYENVGASANWLQVDLRTDGQTPVIGSRVVAVVDGNRTYRYVNARADFASQDSRTVQFGLDQQGTVERLTIEFPNGDTVELTNVEANQRIVVDPDGREEDG